MKNVLLIGAGVSSTDIAKEISHSANTIYQTSRGGMFDLPAKILPENAIRIGDIASFEAPSINLSQDSANLSSEKPIPLEIRLKSGQKLCGIHRVILATGYHMSYPFLRQYHNDDIAAQNADDRVIVTYGSQMHNLHKDIFYIPDPSLTFVGVPYYTATFTLFEFTAMAISAVFSGRAKLPPIELMRKEYAAKLERLGVGRQFNSLKDLEVEYVDELLDWLNSDAKALGLDTTLKGHTPEWHEARKALVARMQSLFGGGPGGNDGATPAAQSGPLQTLGNCG